MTLLELGRILAAFCSLIVASSCFSISYNFDLPNDIPDGGKLWVVLVAGSNSYFNYRHQADVCHAYQVVHAHGVPDENIIVMMYDDIADNEDNPVKGTIINRPKGPDVYQGVPKDYTKDEVTADKFLEILVGSGDANDGKKKLDSGPNDHIFVYFSDHGAKGLVAFPDTILDAEKFISTLKKMHAGRRYSKMVIYMEACESGSMFKGILPQDINIFATTASNATTSSYACYFDAERKTYLGDVYSVKWLEDSDKENLSQVTLEQQFKIVKEETNTSTVCQFGDMSINKMKLSDFQGAKQADDTLRILSLEKENQARREHAYHLKDADSSCGKDAVPGPEVPKVILQRRLELATTQEEKQEIAKQLETLLANRREMEVTVNNIITRVAGNDLQSILGANPELTNFACHSKVARSFHEKCYNLGCNGHAMAQINHFATLCEMKFETQLILDAIEAHCSGEAKTCGVH